MQQLTFRHAHPEDAAALAELEALGFPASEAAPYESIQERIAHFGQHFILIENSGKLLAFVNGMVSNQPTITDNLFDDATLHEADGAWQHVFGLVTHPDHQRRGLATQAMQALINQAQTEGRKGLVLTCKEHLLPFYESLGFTNQGVSASEHGGATWYDMRLTFTGRGCVKRQGS